MSHSRLSAFRRCNRYHRLRYIDGWRPVKDDESLTFGRLVHKGVEGWWSGNEILPESDDPILQAKANEVICGYTRHAWSDRDAYEVLAVERQVIFPLINPESMRQSVTYEMVAVLDLILRRGSDTILVEHKTTSADFSSPDADYWRRLAMDSQLSIYVVAAEAAGFPVNRIIYDVIARPALRLKEATPLESRRFTKAGVLDARQREADESVQEYGDRLRADIDARPERYFARRETARLESEVREGMLDVWQEARQIREAELADRHPRNPDACHVYQTCPYYDICALGVDPAQSSLYRRNNG